MSKNIGIKLFLVAVLVSPLSSKAGEINPYSFDRTLGVKTEGGTPGPVTSSEYNSPEEVPLPLENTGKYVQNYTEAFFKRHYQENQASLLPYDQTKDLVKSHAFRQKDVEVIRYLDQPLAQAYYVLKQHKISGYALQDEINFSGYETHPVLLNIKSLSKNQKLSKNVSSDINFETFELVTKSHVERYVVLKYDYETRLIYDAFYDKSYHKFFELSLKQYLKQYEKALR